MMRPTIDQNGLEQTPIYSRLEETCNNYKIGFYNSESSIQNIRDTTNKPLKPTRTKCKIRTIKNERPIATYSTESGIRDI